ncbi:class I SAM-dependent methyltransferase [Algisphaera agarilytica]|uniref:2-polyprenyl-3-methyl-5-hydroxy-6-metoxy-1, 4-benzoquinol methylase n=1 Tax=Algisphaera agarilytica TaxID=1385975 RepID=A0A7X0LMH5_9BACT|nr:methyltransferase domain-containing protein [Algisphaera agarilytica]MBB6431641.1 2-polyprenyl-3-methyl-5-hydroxy-6-metoxy-1,4-benzoquinol methylase [Algisphaera agarilytica]
MNDPTPTLENYFQLMAANGADHVYRTAVSSGLLDTLAQSPSSASALAEQLDAQAQPIAMLCDVLKTLGVVEHGDGLWRLSPLGDGLLRGPYRTLGDPYWHHLPEFLQTSEPMAQMDDPAESEARYQGQAAALGWMLAPAASWAAESLAATLDAEGKVSILDAGAGSAIWSLSLAKRLPQAGVTAADWPAVLEVAKATAQRMGLADRLELMPGDLAEASFPADSHDVVILANVAHLMPPDALGQTLKRLAATLRPGGRLVVIDVFPGQAAGDLNRTLYTLGLALRTRAGQTHQPDDVIDLLHTAGLERGCCTPIEAVPYTLGMVTATKP